MGMRFTRVSNFDLPDPDDVERALGDVVEEYTDYMAAQASDNAPIDTGALKADILSSVEREAPLSRIFGSDLPYAQRQEYEHKTKNAYFRRAIWQYEQPFYQAIRRALDRRFE